MDYLTHINRSLQNCHLTTPINFLVTGEDQFIQNRVIEDILNETAREGHPVIIIDDVGLASGLYSNILCQYGYNAKNGLSGEYYIFDPFNGVNNVIGLSRFRDMLSIFGYEEKEKAKAQAYLAYIQHLECLKYDKTNIPVSMEFLIRYNSVFSVEYALQNLLEEEIISREYHKTLLSTYAECSAIAADLQNLFFMMMPYAKSDMPPICGNRNDMLVFNFYELGQDNAMRSMILNLINCCLKSGNFPTQKITLLVFDKGIDERTYMYNFITQLATSVRCDVNMHVFSKDIFTLCNYDSLAHVFNRFNARIYSRHLSMNSCQGVEAVCGTVDVIKNSMTRTYDRRLLANTPWDVLLGRNMTETYVRHEPMKEPRYQKEIINRLPQGQGIVEFMGQYTRFTI